MIINLLSANSTEWSNTQTIPMICLSMSEHFVGLALKGLNTK